MWLQFCTRLNMNFSHNEPFFAVLNGEAEIVAQLRPPWLQIFVAEQLLATSAQCQLKENLFLLKHTRTHIHTQTYTECDERGTVMLRQ